MKIANTFVKILIFLSFADLKSSDLLIKSFLFGIICNVDIVCVSKQFLKFNSVKLLKLFKT